MAVIAKETTTEVEEKTEAISDLEVEISFNIYNIINWFISLRRILT